MPGEHLASHVRWTVDPSEEVLRRRQGWSRLRPTAGRAALTALVPPVLATGAALAEQDEERPGGSLDIPDRLTRRQVTGAAVVTEVDARGTGPSLGEQPTDVVLRIFTDRVEFTPPGSPTSILDDQPEPVRLPLDQMGVASATCLDSSDGDRWTGAPWQLHLNGAGHDLQLVVPWITFALLGTIAGWSEPSR